MTERKTKARARTTANATADLSIALDAECASNFAQDDSILFIFKVERKAKARLVLARKNSRFPAGMTERKASATAKTCGDL
jgi:hypothetical protein